MDEIKAFRKSQGWTQKNIAEYLEIPTITYIQWENGTRTPPNYIINLIKYKLKNNSEQIKIDELGRTFNVLEKQFYTGNTFTIYEKESIAFNADVKFWKNEEEKGGKYPVKIKTFQVREIL